MKNVVVLGFLVTLMACTELPVATPPQNEGQALFQYWCAACHGSWPSYPATRLLNQRYGGTPPGALEARTDLSGDFIANLVRNGAPGMPPRTENQISDSDLLAIIEYLSPTGGVDETLLPAATDRQCRSES